MIGIETRTQGVSRRWPERVYGTGNEPDPRFTLANERTLLAWLRTGLALQAFGLAAAVVPVAAHPVLLHWIAAAGLGAGVVVALNAFLRWARVERALRLGQGLPGHRLAPALCLLTSSIAVAALVVVLS